MTPALVALRGGVAYNRAHHITAVRVEGENGFDLLDRVSPRSLFARDGQMLHTVLLRDDGTVLCDIYICVDDLDFVLLAEGLSGAQLVAWLSGHMRADEEVELIDLTDSHEVIGLHGPYSWEVLCEVVGPHVVGVGYLTSFWLETWQGIGFRAGKTGEYGYLLLVPNEHAATVWGTLEDLTEEFELVEATVEDLDLCALENGFWSVRFDGVDDVDPMRLQLGWRVSFDRQAPGCEAVRAARGAQERVAWLVLDEPATQLTLDGQPVGRVLHQRSSELLECTVALALLPHDLAWPGTVFDQGTTAAPPLLVNRSLTMDAQRHSFAARDLDSFPGLVQP